MARTSNKAKAATKKVKAKHIGEIQYRKIAGSIFINGKSVNEGETFWAKQGTISEALMDTIEEVLPKKKK